MILNIMKVYIVGHKGWIAQMYIEQFDQMKMEYTYSNFRGESDEIKQDILKQKPSHILCCMGRTYGTFNGVEYNTIDYLENPGTLVENMNDNLYVPLSLALFAKENSIHFTYMGTGCIFSYEYDTNILSTKTLAGITEESNPNFFGSNYSIVKGYTGVSPTSKYKKEYTNIDKYNECTLEERKIMEQHGLITLIPFRKKIPITQSAKITQTKPTNDK